MSGSLCHLRDGTTTWEWRGASTSQKVWSILQFDFFCSMTAQPKVSHITDMETALQHLWGLVKIWALWLVIQITIDRYTIIYPFVGCTILTYTHIPICFFSSWSPGCPRYLRNDSGWCTMEAAHPNQQWFGEMKKTFCHRWKLAWQEYAAQLQLKNTYYNLNTLAWLAKDLGVLPRSVQQTSTVNTTRKNLRVTSWVVDFSCLFATPKNATAKGQAPKRVWESCFYLFLFFWWWQTSRKNTNGFRH